MLVQPLLLFPLLHKAELPNCAHIIKNEQDCSLPLSFISMHSFMTSKTSLIKRVSVPNSESGARWNGFMCLI